MTGLKDLHAANIARQAEWCPDQVPDLSFRGNELGGECGEAQNVIKKLERERLGWRGSRATKDQLAEELADVVICADLCAVTAGIDLAAAVIAKFNATSEKVGLATKLAEPAEVDIAKALQDAYGRGYAHCGRQVGEKPQGLNGYNDERDAWIRQYMARLPASFVDQEKHRGGGGVIQIREGAYYRSSTGERVGPMHRIRGDAAQVWYSRGQKGDWLPDGRALHGSLQGNLVAEWSPAVGTTRG